jgi:hypothetical protein
MCPKKRGKCAIVIPHATQIPDVMILNCAYGVETNVVKPLEGENYMPKL